MKKQLKIFFLTGLLAIVAAGLIAGNAYALSFGDSIVIERVKSSQFFWSAVVAVTPVVPEITGRYHDIDLDQGAPQIDVRYTEAGGFSQAEFNGFRFWDMTNTIDDFEDVSIYSSNFFGFDESRVSYNSDNIYMNFAGLAFDAGNFVSLQIGGSVVGFFQEPPVTATPEPGTIILVGSGLLGLTGLGRRKFKISK